MTDELFSKIPKKEFDAIFVILILLLSIVIAIYGYQAFTQEAHAYLGIQTYVTIISPNMCYPAIGDVDITPIPFPLDAEGDGTPIPQPSPRPTPEEITPFWNITEQKSGWVCDEEECHVRCKALNNNQCIQWEMICEKRCVWVSDE